MILNKQLKENGPPWGLAIIDNVFQTFRMNFLTPG